MKKFKKILLIVLGIIIIGCGWATCTQEKEASTTVAHAETLEQIQAETKYYLKIPAGTVFEYNNNYLVNDYCLFSMYNEDVGAFDFCVYLDVAATSINPLSLCISVDSNTFTVINDYYILCDFALGELFYPFSGLINFLAEFYYIGSIHGIDTLFASNNFFVPQIVKVESGGGATPEELQNAYQTGFNSGNSGIIPNVGNFETLYINTFLNTLQVDSILNQLTYNAGVYYIYRDEYNKTLIVQKEEDTNLFTIRKIIPIQNQFINSVLYTSLDGWNYSAYGDIITNSFATVQANGLLSEYEVPSIGTYNVGSQNNLLANVFSTIPFYNAQELFVESAGQYETGYANGEEIGYRAGYNDGVDDTLVENEINALNIFYGAVATLRILFTLVGNLLSTPIISDLTVGLFVVGIPATILILDLILAFIMRFFGRSTNTTGDSSGSDGGK